jgi:hypothetical protein
MIGRTAEERAALRPAERDPGRRGLIVLVLAASA